MNILSLDEFLNDLSWSDNVRHKLRIVSDRDDVRYIAAFSNDGKISAAVFTSSPASWPDNLIAVWSKKGDNPFAESQKSRTMRAVEMVAKDGLTVHAAAKLVGIHPSAVHRAITRRANKDICPTCGQIIKTQYGGQAVA